MEDTAKLDNFFYCNFVATRVRGCTFITLENQSQKMKVLPISAYVI